MILTLNVLQARKIDFQLSQLLSKLENILTGEPRTSQLENQRTFELVNRKTPQLENFSMLSKLYSLFSNPGLQDSTIYKALAGSKTNTKMFLLSAMRNTKRLTNQISKFTRIHEISVQVNV